MSGMVNTTELDKKLRFWRVGKGLHTETASGKRGL